VILLSGLSLCLQLPGETSFQSDQVLTELVSDWVQARIDKDPKKQEHAIVQLEETLRAKEIDLSDIHYWEGVFQNAIPYPAHPEGGTQRSQWRDFEKPIAYRVPTQHAGNQNLRPLMLVCGVGEGGLLLQKIPNEIAEKAFLVAVGLENLQEASLSSETRQHFLGSLAFAVQSFPVDRNQVWLLGLPEVQNETRLLSSYFPHLFSQVEVLPLPQGEGLSASSFLNSAPRNPYPLEFFAEFLIPSAGRNFWVQARQFDLPDPVRGPSSLRVKVNRESNTIHLNADRVYRVDLFLNDAIVDLGRPITIFRNGAPSRFLPARSLPVMLENFATNLDAQALFPTVIHGIDIPRQAP
jgi:hypothetical protein|tara:strand:- start:6136 stop:7191 length:1056 start_codon:yes stop_codon:yes gene_type:complete